MLRSVLIGVGHPLRGDDAVGPLVIDRMAPRFRPLGVDCVCVMAPGPELLDALDGHDRAIVIDAAAPAQRVGTVHRFDVASAPLPAALFAVASTHALGLPAMLELGRSLGRLPRDLVVVAVEGQSFQLGESPCAGVVAMLPEVERIVLAEWADIASRALPRADPVSVELGPLPKTTMHEASLFNSLIRKIERLATEQKAIKVAVVRVRLGALAGISPAHFREHFAEAARGKIMEGAELEIIVSKDKGALNAHDWELESIDIDD